MSSASALKKQLSETFAQQLVMPPALDQIAPEALAAAIKGADPAAAVRVIDVRQTEEFNAGHVKGAVSMPMDTFDPEGLVKAVMEDVSNGKKPTVVFASSQSPDIDANCALSFVGAWEEAGADKTTNLAGTAIAVTLLGGVVYWLQQYSGDEALTEAYDAATWDAVLKQARASEADAGSPV